MQPSRMARKACLVLLLAAACGAANAAQVSGRQLLQGDPYTVFNEPTAPGASVAAGAPSVNINGIGAVSNSATTVPVMGTLAAPLPGAGYAAGYAPVAVGGVSVAAPTDQYTYAQPYGGQAAGYPGYAPAAPGAFPGYAGPAAPGAFAPAAPGAFAPAAPGAFAPAPAAAPAPAVVSVPPIAGAGPAGAPAFDPIAAAAGVTPPGGAQQPAPAAAAAAPAKEEPLPPLPAGMIYRKDMREQIPANSSALPVIKVPEGTTAKLAYVCDIGGQLYIAVDYNKLIFCPSESLIQLSKLAGIKGAKAVTCPDNRLACPGGYAVHIHTKLNNTLEEFQKVVPQWRANVATAISMPVYRVVITDVQIVQQSKPAAAKEEGKKEEVKKEEGKKEEPRPAIKKQEGKKEDAKPAKESAKVPNRRLLQKKDLDATAVVQTTNGKSTDGAVTDTEAVVEEEHTPKPKIIVTTTIQPLTEKEASSVFGTTKSPYFDATFKNGTAKLGLQMMDNFWAEQGEIADAFDFPADDIIGKDGKPTKKSANITDLDATNLSAVPLTKDEMDALAKAEAAEKAAASPRAAAASAAGAPAGAAAATAAAVVMAALAVLF